MSQNFLLNTILHTENFESVYSNLSFKVKVCANNAAVNFLIFLGTGLIALKPVPKNLIQFWFRKYIITIFAFFCSFVGGHKFTASVWLWPPRPTLIPGGILLLIILIDQKAYKICSK